MNARIKKINHLAGLNFSSSRTRKLVRIWRHQTRRRHNAQGLKLAPSLALSPPHAPTIHRQPGQDRPRQRKHWTQGDRKGPLGAPRLTVDGPQGSAGG